MHKPFWFAAAVAAMTIVFLPTTAVRAQDTNTGADKAAPAAAAPPATAPPAATTPTAATPSAATPAAATTPATAAEQTTGPKKKKPGKMTRQQEIDRSIDRGTVPARYRSSVPKEYQQYVPFDKR